MKLLNVWRVYRWRSAAHADFSSSVELGIRARQQHDPWSSVATRAVPQTKDAAPPSRANEVGLWLPSALRKSMRSANQALRELPAFSEIYGSFQCLRYSKYRSGAISVVKVRFDPHEA